MHYLNFWSLLLNNITTFSHSWLILNTGKVCSPNLLNVVVDVRSVTKSGSEKGIWQEISRHLIPPFSRHQDSVAFKDGFGMLNFKSQITQKNILLNIEMASQRYSQSAQLWIFWQSFFLVLQQASVWTTGVSKNIFNTNFIIRTHLFPLDSISFVFLIRILIVKDVSQHDSWHKTDFIQGIVFLCIISNHDLNKSWHVCHLKHQNQLFN